MPYSSSDISFGTSNESSDTDSESSVISGQRKEAFYYQGNAVPQRSRRTADPVTEAKTTLIRYLGFCEL
ncbi:hypothetical protein NHQ30_011040 [Ciborinia camelliae]|nr:hypothetical protein NHQ30_011040 [Ciborinia camelliae]